MISSTNHPPSLKVFFATEMWERYGFYVIQTLLALYLASHFQWHDEQIYPLVGAFTALTYLSPMIGGWVADKLIGQKMCILIGALILLSSYLALIFINSTLRLNMALAGIAVGTGLLKPNISSLLGNIYPIDSPNRERGFTIFYMGITTGIILGTTLPSYFKESLGWSASFFSAAIGMLLAIFIFIFGVKKYRITDYSPQKPNFLQYLVSCLILALTWMGAFYVLNQSAIANALFGSIGFLCLVYLAITLKEETGLQAQQTIIIGLLCLISIMFWSFYFQMFLSLTLLIKRIVAPSLFGVAFPPPYYVAIQSIGMIIFGLFLAHNHQKMTLPLYTKRVGNKFIYSMLLMSAGYGLIALICHTRTNDLFFSPLLFIPTYLLIALAELLLSPIGLSAITLLASHKRVSTMMGVFFVSLGLGGFVAGKLAMITAIPNSALKQLNTMELKQYYASSFSLIFYILLIATGIAIFLNYKIQVIAKHIKIK